jgi:hypothetical protein
MHPCLLYSYVASASFLLCLLALCVASVVSISVSVVVRVSWTEGDIVRVGKPHTSLSTTSLSILQNIVCVLIPGIEQPGQNVVLEKKIGTWNSDRDLPITEYS